VFCCKLQLVVNAKTKAVNPAPTAAAVDKNTLLRSFCLVLLFINIAAFAVLNFHNKLVFFNLQVAQKHLNTKIKNKTVLILSFLRQIVIHSSYYFKRFMVDIQ